MAAELDSSVWILAAWIVGGIITLFGALSNAEVAGLLADTGGDFIYFKKIYNRFFAFYVRLVTIHSHPDRNHFIPCIRVCSITKQHHSDT